MAITPVGLHVPTSIVSVFDDADLKNLANGAELTSAEIDNDGATALGDVFADLVAALQYEAAPAAGTLVASVYLVPAVDGTNYPTVTAGGLPPAVCQIGVLVSQAPATDALEYLVIPGISLPPGKFKIVISNTSGQSYKNADGTGMLLKLRMYRLGSGS